MRTRVRAATVVGVVALSALAGCGGGGSSADESGGESSGDDYSGPPPCSDYADGQTIDEAIERNGCEDEATTVNQTSTCDGHVLLAVGPVYGFVGKPANYLGEGVDATKSEEWQTFQQECPYDSE